jgi:hypothetical protein
MLEAFDSIIKLSLGHHPPTPSALPRLVGRLMAPWEVNGVWVVHGNPSLGLAPCGKEPSISIDFPSLNVNLPVVRRRLYQAGVRLAMVLNETFPGIRQE